MTLRRINKEACIKFRALRGYEGLTQKKFAKKLGVSFNLVRKIEYANRNVSKDVANKCITIFKVDSEYFSANDKEKRLFKYLKKYPDMIDNLLKCAKSYSLMKDMGIT